MKLLPLAGAICAASLLSACADGSLASRAVPGLSLQRPHLHYGASVKNADGAATLRVINTHKGQCMYREFPNMDLISGAKWTGQLDTKGSGSCALSASVQIIKFEYAHNVLEVGFFKEPGFPWNAVKVGGSGILRGNEGIQISCRNGAKIECDVAR